MKEKTTTQIGMVGLGRMGANMMRRLIKGGHQCVVFNRSPQKVRDLVKEKAIGASSLADLNEESPEAAGSLVDGACRSRGPVHR
jgi:6-phosphogluconate dehydrogenase